MGYFSDRNLVENNFHITAKTFLSFARARRRTPIIDSEMNFVFDSSGERFFIEYDYKGESIKQSIEFAPCQVGYGERLFIVCPSCNSNCNALYLKNAFLCRKCSGYYYTSTMKQRNKLARQKELIREKQAQLKMIGCKLLDPPEEIPRYMHRATFERLMHELFVLQRDYVKITNQKYAKFLK